MISGDEIGLPVGVVAKRQCNCTKMVIAFVNIWVFGNDHNSDECDEKGGDEGVDYNVREIIPFPSL